MRRMERMSEAPRLPTPMTAMFRRMHQPRDAYLYLCPFGV
jgi:hypothetical protein